MAGRPPIKFDWKEIDNLLIAGCSGREIAGYLKVDKKTIYDSCVREKGMSFSEYLDQMRAKGESLIKAQRFAKAIGKTDKGDNTLLIWLSKVRLGEKEPKHDDGQADSSKSLNINITNYSDKEVEVAEQ